MLQPRNVSAMLGKCSETHSPDSAIDPQSKPAALMSEKQNTCCKERPEILTC